MEPRNQQSVNKEAVFTVLEELGTAGIKPTVELIREHIGSAPYSTVSAYISEWNSRMHQPMAEKFPTPPDTVAQGLARLWAQARLLSDEETEHERLNLGYHRQEIEKEKQEMITEIQRLESDIQPQESLRERFDVERNKFHNELDSLNTELKELRLNQVDTQRFEREALGAELQQGQSRKELETKAAIIEKLLAEKEALQDSLTSVEVKQSTELNKTQHTLSLAQSRIETLLYQLEDQKQAAIAPEKITDLETHVDNLKTQLSHNKSKLEISINNENEQRSKQQALELDLTLEQQSYKELEKKYSQVKSELDTTHDIVVQSESDLDKLQELESKIQKQATRESQFQKVLKDKQTRCNVIANNCELLQKENDALRSATKIQGAISRKSIEIEDFEVHDVTIHDLSGKPELDTVDTSKLKEGEDILELARMFVIEDEKKARGE